jgi:hypothetical protein
MIADNYYYGNVNISDGAISRPQSVVVTNKDVPTIAGNPAR